jgi:site-specific DNA-methyltransferase (adenine-specific)
VCKSKEERIKEVFNLIELHNIDCMEAMEEMPDKAFDLAIVDPPYGIGMDGKVGIDGSAEAKNYTEKQWDKKPPADIYFTELLRVSKHQIVWGANHFISKLPYDSPCWIVWDKEKVGGFYADCELAWTSFDTAVRQFTFAWHGFIQGQMGHWKEHRIHPTQKPVKLYEWLLMNYAKPGDKILDTHSGSLSIGIACHNLGYDLTAFEIDEEYFEGGKARLEQHQRQGKLFDVGV